MIGLYKLSVSLFLPKVREGVRWGGGEVKVRGKATNNQTIYNPVLSPKNLYNE